MPSINFIPHPLTGTPMGAALDLCVILAILCWLAAVLTREYSWVDRLWSICPPVYCLIVAFSSGFEMSRVNVMTLLAVLWGARLTFNFARKGGYGKGGEDYRWETVRERYGPIGIQVMNATFIAPGQMLLIWWFTAPIHAAWEAGDTPMGGLDYLAAGLFLVLLVGETVADEQMWAFQEDKRRRIAAGEEVAQPFLNTGLYRYSRHPNYFCELGMWCVFYLFAVSASGEWIHWTGLGCLMLIALFVGSIRLGESISAGKYPGYGDYQASVPCVIPGLRLGKP